MWVHISSNWHLQLSSFIEAFVLGLMFKHTKQKHYTILRTNEISETYNFEIIAEIY